MWDEIPDFLKRQEINRINSAYDTDLEKMLSSHSYDATFITNRIFTCSNCLKKGHNMSSFASYDFINNFINIDDSDDERKEYNHKRGFFSINDDELETIMNIIECPNCHRKYRIIQSEQVYYIWERQSTGIAADFDEEHDYIDKIQTFKIESYV